MSHKEDVSKRYKTVRSTIMCVKPTTRCASTMLGATNQPECSEMEFVCCSRRGGGGGGEFKFVLKSSSARNFLHFKAA